MDFFTESEFYNKTFKGLNSNNNRSIHLKEFYDCTFKNCACIENDFIGCRFVDCVFEECDLSIVKVKRCVFRGVTFKDTKIIGVNWTESAIPVSVDFFDSVISYCNFMGLNLKGIRIIRCTAKEVNFVETNLTQASCKFTDFSGSQFLNTNLTRADFSDAKNYSISPDSNLLKKTKFSLPEAVSLLQNLDIVLTD